jgi:hypothetical protein
MIDFGTLPPPALMDDLDRMFLAQHHLLLGAIHAELDETVEAAEITAKASPFATQLFDDRGVAGYDYLLIARVSNNPNVVTDALHQALQKLENGHADPACRYNLACTLSKMSDFTPDAEKDKLVKRATELLTAVVDYLKKGPVEPQIEAIRADPFLRAVVSQPVVKKALDSFVWDPYVVRPDIPLESLWHFGIPLKRYHFTRLNGDNRR